MWTQIHTKSSNTASLHTKQLFHSSHAKRSHSENEGKEEEDKILSVVRVRVKTHLKIEIFTNFFFRYSDPKTHKEHGKINFIELLYGKFLRIFNFLNKEFPSKMPISEDHMSSRNIKTACKNFLTNFTWVIFKFILTLISSFFLLIQLKILQEITHFIVIHLKYL
jgi:hypothetical protein